MVVEAEIIGRPVAKNKNDLMIVKSKVRGLIKTFDCNTSDAVFEVINTCLEKIIEKAVVRAKADGRKTVKLRDI